ncbi:MAG: sugar phosphate isomerase/epimerase, partial [Desulfatiglandaceae bacterium]
YLCHGPREGDPNDIRSLESRYRPKLFQVLSLMPLLAMQCLTIHLWMDPRFVTSDAIAYKVKLLKGLLKKSDDAGITLCIENLSETADHLTEAFAALPRLYMTLDVGHAQLLTKQNTAPDLIDRFSDRIKHIHIHDNRGGDSPEDDLHLPLGQGILDFDEIFHRLYQAGYGGTMTLELTPSEIEQNLDRVKALLTQAGFNRNTSIIRGKPPGFRPSPE